MSRAPCTEYDEAAGVRTLVRRDRRRRDVAQANMSGGSVRFTAEIVGSLHGLYNR
jgi:hypothetical protein